MVGLILIQDKQEMKDTISHKLLVRNVKLFSIREYKFPYLYIYKFHLTIGQW